MQEIYNILALRLESLRKKGDSITLYDISGILEEVSKYLGGGQSEFNVLLQNEIVKIANHIETTKKEFISLVPEEMANQNITQLEAVIKATEEAAGTIMDAADEIQKIIQNSNASQETKDKIVDVTTRLYEACNFQDLTGQRIIKVMRELEFVESKINYLTRFFSNNGSANAGEFRDTREGNTLLNGPQLPSNAPSQQDIDALFKDISNS